MFRSPYPRTRGPPWPRSPREAQAGEDLGAHEARGDERDVVGLARGVGPAATLLVHGEPEPQQFPLRRRGVVVRGACVHDGVVGAHLDISGPQRHPDRHRRVVDDRDVRLVGLALLLRHRRRRAGLAVARPVVLRVPESAHAPVGAVPHGLDGHTMDAAGTPHVEQEGGVERLDLLRVLLEEAVVCCRRRDQHTLPPGLAGVDAQQPDRVSGVAMEINGRACLVLALHLRVGAGVRHHAQDRPVVVLRAADAQVHPPAHEEQLALPIGPVLDGEAADQLEA
mmetsp:Transcript_62797/g.177120  ORF Transcript_62797/g.177120 Transcript_62797/m.177120 type:complete len:281 (-) Transcript_62797:363-1205(-)